MKDIVVDTFAMEVKRGDETLAIRGLTYRLWLFLLRHGQRVVSHDQIVEGVWDGAVIEVETITQRIKLLRQALGDDSHDPRYILTVRGSGYRLLDSPQWIVDHAGPPAPSKPRGRLVSLAAALVLVTALGVLAVDPRGPRAVSSRDGTLSAELLERADSYRRVEAPSANEMALELYDEVLRRNDGSIGAMLGKSLSLSQDVSSYNGSPDRAVTAELLARRAIELAPQSAVAYAALAYSYDSRGRLREALDAYEWANRLDPSNPGALESAAHIHQVRGHLSKALELAVEAQNLSPRGCTGDVVIGRVLASLGYSDRAEGALERAFLLCPGSVCSNVSYPRFLLSRGRLVAGREAIATARRRGVSSSKLEILEAELALLNGDPEEARRLLRIASRVEASAGFARSLELIYGGAPREALRERLGNARRADAGGGEGPAAETWIEISLLASALGETDEAIHALRRSVDAGFLDRDYLLASPLFSETRSHRSFDAVVARLTQRLAMERQRIGARPWALRPAGDPTGIFTKPSRTDQLF